jgi:hypothetical protein
MVEWAQSLRKTMRTRRVYFRRLNGWLDKMEARAKGRLLRDIESLSSTPEDVDGWALPDIL